MKSTVVIVIKQTSYLACLSLLVEAEFLLSWLYSLQHLVANFYALKVYKQLPPACQIMYLKGLGSGFQLLESYLLLVYLLFGEKEETIIIGRMEFWALPTFIGSPCILRTGREGLLTVLSVLSLPPQKQVML